MKVLARIVQHIYPDKWEALEQYEKDYAALEAKHGFPPKKRYRLVSGPDHGDTLNVEYVWESMAAMEADYEKILVDPKMPEFNARIVDIVKDTRIELYQILPS